jgi:hypothetical protein
MLESGNILDQEKLDYIASSEYAFISSTPTPSV